MSTMTTSKDEECFAYVDKGEVPQGFRRQQLKDTASTMRQYLRRHAAQGTRRTEAIRGKAPPKRKATRQKQGRVTEKLRIAFVFPRSLTLTPQTELRSRRAHAADSSIQGFAPVRSEASQLRQTGGRVF